MSNQKLDELLGEFRGLLNFTEKVMSSPTRNQIYNIILEQTFSEKKYMHWENKQQGQTFLLCQNLLPLIS